MFNDSYDLKSEFTAPPRSFLENWTKRYKSKRNIIKHKNADQLNK